MKQDYAKLLFILESFKKIDPVYLEALHYRCEEDLEMTEDHEDFEKDDYKET